MSTSPSLAANTSFRSLVLPREHGSWSLALEPVALGLLVAPSAAGAWLALAVIAGFFTRRPLKLAVTLASIDPRRAAAFRWMLLFAAIALGSLFASGSGAMSRTMPSSDWRALWPLLLAVPFGAAFLWFDLRGEMREAEAELAGAATFALLPATFATLAGWDAASALALASLMLVRCVPTLLTVRAYLRFAKGKPASALPALAVTLAAFVGIAALAAWQLVPLSACALVCVLGARTAWLLSPLAPAWSPRRIGLMEAIVGLVYLTTLAAAYGAR